MDQQWLRPQTWWRFVCFVYKSFTNNKGVENAKSLTFTSLFAVVPLLTLTVAILSAFPSFQVFGNQIEGMIFDRLLPSSSEQLEEYIASFASQAKNLTWVGALMLMATAYLMLVNIERNFNNIWGVGELRKGLHSFLLYWSVLSLSPLLLGIGFAMSSYITSLSLVQTITQVSDSVAGGSSLRLVLFPMFLTTLAFTLLYVAVPNCGVRIRHAMVGGLVVAISFSLAKKIFTWFISKASYELVYGTFAALPIFLIWIYMCWIVILVGANLVRCLPLFREESAEEKVHPSLLMFALLHKFWDSHQKGKSVTIQSLIQNKWPFQGLKIDEYLDILVERKIIRDLSQDEYVLSQDLHGISLWEFLQKLPWAQPTSDDFQHGTPEVLIPHLPVWENWKALVQDDENQKRQLLGASVDQCFRSGTMTV